MKNSFRFVYFVLSVTCLATVALADVKIKTRNTASGQTSESTVYIKGKRQRTEMAGGAMTMLLQCDLKRDVQIMPPAKAYLINQFNAENKDNSNDQIEQSTVRNPPSAVKRGGVVTTTVTSKDTGERKQMFGYTARHVISTMITESSPDACSVTNSKMETDGWYIDAAFNLDCQNDRAQSYIDRDKNAGCQDKYNYQTVGSAKMGYPIYTKMTMFDESGKPSLVTTSEVVELSNAALDPALFEIPTDYREVKDMSEMYQNAAATIMSVDSSDDASSLNSNHNAGVNQNVKNMANKTVLNNSEIGAKKPGVVRLGLANVKTGAVGEGLNAADLAAAIKNTLAEYLKSPNLELIQLEAKLPSAIDAEGKQKECDFIIYTNVSHKKGGGGGFGMFKKMAPVLSNVVPMAGMGGSVAGAVAGQIASTAIYTTASMSGNVKSKDEIVLEYKLISTNDGTSVAANTLKAKAKSNGEDIISPLIEQAAGSIIEAASKK